MKRRIASVAAGVAIVMAAFAGPALAVVGRGSAGAPLTISLAGPTGTTTTTATIGADGTYKADFGISQIDDYTGSVKKADGTTLASMPIKVTQSAKPCITPTAGTGTDWGVTHSPFPFDPRFPSYVTICGHVALTATGNPVTPAGSPPSVGSGSSASRGDANDSATESAASGDDDGGGSSWIWIVVAVVVVGVGVIGVLVWRRMQDDAVGSMYPDYSDDPPDDDPPDEDPPNDEPPTPKLDVM